MADFGYDISDYYSVDPVFGNLDDIQELIDQAHQRGIKVLIDLVANHTSDEHPWFIESRSSKNSYRRDWYIWRDGLNDGPPNDWLSVFGGSAWQYDKDTNQYYLHSFSSKQPDLNWANPQVRRAVKEFMSFWLDLGVDGFRADAIYWLAKDHRFRNDPLKYESLALKSSDYDNLAHTYSRNRPQLYKYLRGMTTILRKYKDRFMVIEAEPEGADPAHEYLKFYRYVDPSHMAPFNFEGIYYPWKASVFKLFIDRFQRALKKKYLPVYTFGNHDKSRLASRFGEAAAPSAAVLLLTLPGMPFIYYGEEIGMQDGQIPSLFRKDPLQKRGPDRDEARTPMQWSSSAYAGFSQGRPWLPPAKDYRTRNVKNQLADPDSILNLYRELIKLRNSSKALKYGSYKPLDTANLYVLGFSRKYGRQNLIVLVNFKPRTEQVKSKELSGRIVLSSDPKTEKSHVNGSVELRPNEAVIIAT
ncbi:MAG TPA: alpha-amylase family glycosyl hydrolase, partial [Candidatus Saccharimonadales bacterium]|nr:alpha-amylase family glycosyl hydrolase [Candidatus Saccharimonadales bacterium]